MAVFPVNLNSHCHICSNSLSSITHPLILQFEEHFCRLRSSGATYSSSSMVDKLKNLQDLYASANKLLLLPLTQQTLAKEQNEWIDEQLGNEFLKVAATLQLIIFPKTSNSNDLLVNIQNQLENLEMCIEDLEGGLEKLSRVLIKNRVSLLNILNH